ncbi:MAG: caib/baif family protein [Pseudomonadota bacterium]|nr:caib/baif family protein [Patescibacteria group bacterium]
MNAREFESAYKDLLRDYEHAGENPMSYGVTDCKHCASCHFCRDCEACYRCTHCVSLLGCSHCTRCQGCQNCHGSAYCIDSTNCSGSKYLIRCEACSDCTYCFGSVGLTKKDFHILNQPYARSAYFELTGALQKALGIKAL